jgi:hypothetical protein
MLVCMTVVVIAYIAKVIRNSSFGTDLETYVVESLLSVSINA